MIETASRISRKLIAALALVTLAGCAGGTSSSDLSPATPEPQMAAAPPPPTCPPTPPRTAGRAAQSAPAAPPPPAKQAALTPEEAKGKCWMKYENDRRAKGIDERLEAGREMRRRHDAQSAAATAGPIVYAASACSAVIASPATVVRRMSRGWLSSKRRTRCMVCRLSHITRSYCRQRWT